MSSRFRDDDDGQIDGDASPVRSPFAQNFGEQPWLRMTLPPWHMWGTIEQVSTVATVTTLPANFTGSSQQLSKISYKRPETWQWLFYARILSAPNGAGGGSPAEFGLDFDVTIGLGRASVTLATFERFAWTWPGAPALSDVKWSTAGRQPPRITGSDTLDHSLLQLVAQDIQVNARFAAGSTDQVTPFKLEIGSFFAPRTHIRPDWYLPRPQPFEAKFPGSETGGT